MSSEPTVFIYESYLGEYDKPPGSKVRARWTGELNQGVGGPCPCNPSPVCGDLITIVDRSKIISIEKTLDGYPSLEAILKYNTAWKKMLTWTSPFPFKIPIPETGIFVILEKMEYENRINYAVLYGEKITLLDQSLVHRTDCKYILKNR